MVMRHNLILIGAFAMALLLVSTGFVVKASAYPYSDGFYYGNGDGEFDCSTTDGCYIYSGYATIVAETDTNVKATVGSPGDPGYDMVSLQYNPDVIESNGYQNWANWMQATLEVNQSYTPPVAYWDYYLASTDNGSQIEHDYGGQYTTGALTSGATWEIVEDEAYGNVNQIYYELDGAGSGAQTLSHYYYPESYGNYESWLRSNPCWCGFAGDAASFNSGSGYLWAESNTGLTDYWGSPTYAGTGESSDMYYGCWNQYASDELDQYFSPYSVTQC
jgi:hypothetical protein